MSFAWAFYTVSGPQFENYFLGQHPNNVGRLLSALTWDEGAIDDEVAQFVASRIANHGLDYSGLDQDDARLLDECLSTLTSDEGLAGELEREPVSPDFVHPSVIESLLRAAITSKVDVRLLPVLRSGRRYAESQPSPDCNYCYLYPSEARELAAELSAILAATKSWGKESWMPELVSECLLQPLNTAVNTDRPLLGLLG